MHNRSKNLRDKDSTRAYSNVGRPGPRRLLGGQGIVFAALVTLALSLSTRGYAANMPPVDDRPKDLTELDLEQLMKIEVTSVSKQAQPISQAAAAVFVISQEDIRRSGVTSIPEALRMAPGIQVARIDSHRWAISARGFNGEFANKLLVLMDGRTLYSPLYSGVFWDVQDTVLEDVDRIEVIRGPGTSLWGANAVNGVINIITKKAKDTQGLLAVAGAGTEERGFTTLRYGGSIGADTQYRLYGKHFERDNFSRMNGSPGHDSWRNTSGGFRLDHEATSRDSIMVQGSHYKGSADSELREQLLVAPFQQDLLSRVHFSGSHILSRWKHAFDDGSSFVVQSYYDRTEREGAVLSEHHDIFDVDAQHAFGWGQAQRIVWGGGYRAIHNRFTNSDQISLIPSTRFTSLFSGFIQDEITLVPDRLAFIGGTKLEHNDFIGFVVQPSGRVRWTPTDRLTFWGSVSRGVRTPSLSEDDIRVRQQTFPGLPPTLVAGFGNRGFQGETVAAYELGSRWQAHEQFSIDVAAFFNRYDNLRSFEQGTPFLATNPAPPHVVVPFHVGNKLSAETYGVEVYSEWRPYDWWRLHATYTYLMIRMLPGISTDPTGKTPEGESPRHQGSLRSLMKLPGNLELDLWGRYVDRLPAIAIPGYFDLDVRLGWRPIESFDISVVGQNLVEPQRPEFLSTLGSQASSQQIQRGMYVKLTWRY
jgi:iron complex outermembrane recepter protein